MVRASRPGRAGLIRDPEKYPGARFSHVAELFRAASPKVSSSSSIEFSLCVIRGQLDGNSKRRAQCETESSPADTSYSGDSADESASSDAPRRVRTSDLGRGEVMAAEQPQPGLNHMPPRAADPATPPSATKSEASRDAFFCLALPHDR